MPQTFTKPIVLAEWPPRRGSKVGRALDWAKRTNEAPHDEFSAENHNKAMHEVASALFQAMYQAHHAQECARIADSLSTKEQKMLLEAVTSGGVGYSGAGGWQTYRGLRRKKLIDGWGGWACATRLGRRVARVLSGGKR